MARRRDPAESFRATLEKLSDRVPETLTLPSLRDNRLEGFAHLYTVVLPLLSAEGDPIFVAELTTELYWILDLRFGGCMVASSSSSAPFWGLWHPDERSEKPEKDYLTTVQVLANPIDPSATFFRELKEILKTGGIISQEEILIIRQDCWLM